MTNTDRRNCKMSQEQKQIRFSRPTIHELAEAGLLKNPAIIFHENKFTPYFTLEDEVVFVKRRTGDNSDKPVNYKALRTARDFMKSLGFTKTDEIETEGGEVL